MTVNVRTTLREEGVVFRFWNDTFDEAEARRVSEDYASILSDIIDNPRRTVTELDNHRAGLDIVTEETTPVTGPKTVPEVEPVPKSIPAPVPTFAEEVIIDEPAVPEQPTTAVAAPTAFDPNMIQSIVNQAVRDTIAELFKSGALGNFNAPVVSNVIDRNTARRFSNTSRRLSTASRRLSNSATAASTIAALSAPAQAAQVSEDDVINKRLSLMNAEETKQVAVALMVQETAAERVEKQLLAIWCSLLGLSADDIGPDDSFFQLGGDSIVAMKMVGAARKQGLRLTVADIFREPTLAGLAASTEEVRALKSLDSPDDDKANFEINIQASESEFYQRFSLLEATNVNAFLQDTIAPKVRIFRGGIADVYPVTDFQALAVTGTLLESRWMLNYFYLDGEGALDLQRLKQAVYKLVKAYDILRTVFVLYGDRFLQVVLRKLQPEFRVYETERDLADFTESLKHKDQKQGPPLGESYVQFTVAKKKGTMKHRIIMRLSHAQYDGVCFPAILSALKAGYDYQLIPTIPSYSTYVRDALRKTTLDHYDYWKNLLKGSSMTEVVKRTAPNYDVVGDVTILRKMVMLPSLVSVNITPATIVKAAWALTLAKLSGKSDIVFGHVISGRNAAVYGIENIVGPCLNMVPVRIKFQDNWTVLDLLRVLQEQQVANMPFESLGFRQITKHCTDWPDWTNFSSVVQHQNIDQDDEFRFANNSYKVGALGSQENLADITIHSQPQADSADKMELHLSYIPGREVTDEFAAEALEMLGTIASELFARTTQALPSPTELQSLAPQTFQETPRTKILPGSTPSSNSNDSDLLVLTDTLSRAWRQILRGNSHDALPLHLETSFFSLGGDIMGLAQISSLLEQEGFKIRVEDLIDHPTMMEQITLLTAASAKEAAKKRNQEKLTLPSKTPSVTSLSENNMGNRERDRALASKRGKFWAKSVGRARKIMVGRRMQQA